MTSEAKRNPVDDELLTPENCALVIIDYQPTQISSIKSHDPQLIIDNIVRTARIANTYSLPVVLSTVNVQNGTNGPTIEPLRAVLPAVEELDRTSINAWEDAGFRQAVEATGRRRLVMAAIWTEVCLTFPALDALQAGYQIFPVIDAVAGTSLVAHDAGLERMYLAGARPTSVAQLVCELQRDWARVETVESFKEILTSVEQARSPALAMTDRTR
jgi:nicotinamidase-related amidase